MQIAKLVQRIAGDSSALTVGPAPKVNAAKARKRAATVEHRSRFASEYWWSEAAKGNPPLKGRKCQCDRCKAVNHHDWPWPHVGASGMSYDCIRPPATPLTDSRTSHRGYQTVDAERAEEKGVRIRTGFDAKQHGLSVKPTTKTYDFDYVNDPDELRNLPKPKDLRGTCEVCGEIRVSGHRYCCQCTHLVRLAWRAAKADGRETIDRDDILAAA